MSRLLAVGAPTVSDMTEGAWCAAKGKRHCVELASCALRGTYLNMVVSSRGSNSNGEKENSHEIKIN